MTGRLDEALRQLLIDSLPALFGGATPVVQVSVAQDLFTFGAQSAEAEAGEPRVDDQTDQFPFVPATPGGPYTLTKPPLPGPRRVRLTSVLGDRVPLVEGEILPDPNDDRVFRLQPRADRNLAQFNGVQVLYGITSVFVRLQGVQTFVVNLQSADAVRLEQAESLALAVIELNRKRLVERSPESFTDADYAAAVSAISLKFVKATAPAAATQQLHYAAEVAIKASRALAAGEGRPILSIRSPGRPADPARAVDIEAFVDA